MLTDAAGNYLLVLKTGTHRIAVQPRRGFYQTAPHTLVYTVNVVAGGSLRGDVFGVKAIAPA